MERQRVRNLRGKECAPAGRVRQRDQLERARYRLCDVVLPQLDFRDFVTRMDVSGTLDGKYEKDVADELRYRYSDRPRR
jgi:hypothetical protein